MPSYIPPTLLALPFHLTSGPNKQGRPAAEILFILKPLHVWFFSFHPAFTRSHTHATDLSSQCTILQSKRHLQRQWEECTAAATQTLISMSTASISKKRSYSSEPREPRLQRVTLVPVIAASVAAERWQNRGLESLYSKASSALITVSSLSIAGWLVSIHKTLSNAPFRWCFTVQLPYLWKCN